MWVRRKRVGSNDCFRLGLVKQVVGDIRRWSRLMCSRMEHIIITSELHFVIVLSRSSCFGYECGTSLDLSTFIWTVGSAHMMSLQPIPDLSLFDSISLIIVFLYSFSDHYETTHHN